MLLKKYDFIYFIGDSYTVGEGQDDDPHCEVTMKNRYCQLVADRFNLSLINHAEAGCSNDFIARTITKDMIEYKEKSYNPLVVVSYTNFSRREVWWEKFNVPTTLNLDMKIYKDYVTDHYNEAFDKKVTRYHMASIKHLLKYMQYDFVETWSGEVVHDPLLNRTTELLPQFIDIAGNKGCFIVKNVNKPGTHRGHLNAHGNKVIAKHIIDKIVELYG